MGMGSSCVRPGSRIQTRDIALNRNVIMPLTVPSRLGPPALNRASVKGSLTREAF